MLTAPTLKSCSGYCTSHLATEGELAAVGQKVAEDGRVNEESPDFEQSKAETKEPGTKESDEEADESVEPTTNSAADEREKINRDERPEIRQFFGKGFRRRKTLVNHERLHTVENPFRYEFCLDDSKRSDKEKFLYDSRFPAKVAGIDDVKNVRDKTRNTRHRKAFEYFMSKSEDEESESETEDEPISRNYVLDEENTNINRAQNSNRSGDGNISLIRADIVLTRCYKPQYTKACSEDEARNLLSLFDSRSNICSQHNSGVWLVWYNSKNSWALQHRFQK